MFLSILLEPNLMWQIQVSDWNVRSHNCFFIGCDQWSKNALKRSEFNSEELLVIKTLIIALRRIWVLWELVLEEMVRFILGNHFGTVKSFPNFLLTVVVWSPSNLSKSRPRAQFQTSCGILANCADGYWTQLQVHPGYDFVVKKC